MNPLVVGCSTITFRHLSRGDALAEIRALGFAEIDLGILPGLCDHYDLKGAARETTRRAVEEIRASHLRVRTVNLHPGNFTSPGASPAAIRSNFRKGAALARELDSIGVSLSPGDPPPAGLERDYMETEAAGLRGLADIASQCGTKLLLEAPHFFRLLNSVALSLEMYDRIGRPDVVQLVLDTAHVRTGTEDVADAAALYGPRLAHIHVRDARPGVGFLPMGKGDINFTALIARLQVIGYQGALALELPLMSADSGYFAANLTGAVAPTRKLSGAELTEAKRLEVGAAKAMLDGILARLLRGD